MQHNHRPDGYGRLIADSPTDMLQVPCYQRHSKARNYGSTDGSWNVVTFQVLITRVKRKINSLAEKSIPTHAPPLHLNCTVFFVHFESSLPSISTIAVYNRYVFHFLRFPIPSFYG